MIKVSKNAGKKVDRFEYNDFTKQFDKWDDARRLSFQRKVYTSKTFEFASSIYEFEDMDYVKFRAKYRI